MDEYRKVVYYYLFYKTPLYYDLRKKIYKLIFDTIYINGEIYFKLYRNHISAKCKSDSNKVVRKYFPIPVLYSKYGNGYNYKIYRFFQDDSHYGTSMQTLIFALNHYINKGINNFSMCIKCGTLEHKCHCRYESYFSNAYRKYIIVPT